MNMPPIKFEIKPGMWVGVGDRVWVTYSGVYTGIITGFSGDEDDWIKVEVTSTDMRKMDHTFDHVFASESDAWRFRISVMIEERNELQKRLSVLDKAIFDLNNEWGI